MIAGIVTALMAGIVIGAFGQWKLGKDASATSSELEDWAARLRDAAKADAQIVKAKLTALAMEIEKKL